MIYVLIPAHDEAATIGVLLWKIRQVFTSFAREYQLVVVNDGSTDATAETLVPYARALPLTVLTNRQKKGYASSLEQLVRAALERTDRPRRDLAVTLQADFSDSPDDIPEMIRRLEGGADIVVAAGRRARAAGALGRLVRWALPGALRRTLGTPGAAGGVATLRAYRLGVLERLVRERGRERLLEREDRSADVELLVRAGRHARRVEVIPASAAQLPAQRPSRAAAVTDSWTAWRTAVALRSLAREPAPALPAPGPERREPVAAVAGGDPEEQGPRRGGRGRRRGRRGGRGGRGRGAGNDGSRTIQPPAQP